MKNNKIQGHCLIGLMLFAGGEGFGASPILLQGPEIFPMDPKIEQLRSADFDDDGFEDLLVVNGRRSRLQILYHQSTNEDHENHKVQNEDHEIQNHQNEIHQNEIHEVQNEDHQFEINQLPPDARFQIEPISVEERVSSVVVADLIGDEKPDIAYCGNLEEVIILENRGKGRWRRAARLPFSQILPGPRSLQLGDLNGDGTRELLLLTASSLFQIPISADRDVHQIRDIQNVRPIQMPISAGIESALIADFSGDDIDDVMFLPKSNSEFAFFHPSTKGRPSASQHVIELGESRHTSLIKSVETKLMIIARRTGRAQLGSIQKREIPSNISSNKSSNMRGALLRIPLPKGKAEVESFSSDINSDGLIDLISADGESGKLLVYLQSPHGSYDLPREFGSFSDIGQIRFADWDADGIVDIFLLSYAEKQVGHCRWNDKKGIAFPTSIDLEGTPMGMAIGKIGEDHAHRLVILEKVFEKRDGRYGLEENLYLRVIDPELRVSRHLVNLKIAADRVDLQFHDVDQDGLEDVIMLAAYQDLWVLRQTRDGKFDPIHLPSGMRDLEKPWVGKVDFDGDGIKELVVPQRNAVRGIVLEMRDGKGLLGTANVKSQINGSEGDSIIGGIVDLSNLSNFTNLKDASNLSKSSSLTNLKNSKKAKKPISMIVALLDVKLNEITFMKQKADGQWETFTRLPLPPGDYRSLDEAVLNFGTHPALHITASGRSLIQVLGGHRWEFVPQGTYETQLKGGYLGGATSGDFDHDSLIETAFLETARHHLEMISWDAQSHSRLLYRWPVFETRTFRNRRNELPEPREAMIKDFTGDGRADLVLIVHDRVLLYPQR